ncbi:hypothetical protein PIB30_041959 [Stylosanthes scabra]|uniref:Uncharacterized protein n=1 Tax=Stylosanthes scabra TaxID=79078 RepID=A0ABU6UDP3_9FABA|nr:hypothetical protein [Stylosanthes scabra]
MEAELLCTKQRVKQCGAVGEWGEVGLDQCRWGWVRHWLLVGADRVTHRLATALNHCMSAGGDIGGRGGDAGQGHRTGPSGGDAGCPRGTGGGGGAVGVSRGIGAPFTYKYRWLGGKTSNKPQKGTSNMVGQQGEEQLERNADINRLDRIHHVAGAIGFQLALYDLRCVKLYDLSVWHVGLRQWRRSREPSDWVELGIYNGEWRGKFDPVIVPLNISRLNERRSILQENAMAEI